ncbi:MAG: hypothetical protein JNM79_02005 [Burkholderiales bacterium]|nr:hypothetical protein [Burkholderiales bacterium]
MKSIVKGSVLGAVDQALLSAFSLLLNLAFIRWTGKEEFGTFSLAIASLLLIQSIQNALVNSPLTTLQPSLTDDDARRRTAGAGFVIQLALVGIAALVVLVCAGWLSSDSSDGSTLWMVFGVGVAAIGLLIREYVRGGFFLLQQPARALSSDALYVGSAAVAIAAGSVGYAFGATLVLCVIGVAGALSGLPGMLRLARERSTLREIRGEDLGEFAIIAKWALPSVLVTWAYSNAFVYIVDHFSGKAAVADLSAARLLLVPLTLIVAGWSSAFRPRASAMLAASQRAQLTSLVLRSVTAVGAIVVCYGLVLWLALPVLELQLLGAKYIGLGPVVLAWMVFFGIMSVRMVGMAAMMSSKSAFKSLFFYGLVALAVAVPGVLLAARSDSLAMVVLALAAAEGVLAALIWLVGWPGVLAGQQSREGDHV